MNRPETSLACRRRTRSLPERRAEPRRLCADLLEMCWSTPAGVGRREIAVIEDYSAMGASLFMGVPVPPETSVHMNGGSGILRGRVRYCDLQQNGYLVGVEFDPECRNEAYLPEHFLDVTQLDFTPEEG